MNDRWVEFMEYEPPVFAGEQAEYARILINRNRVLTVRENGVLTKIRMNEGTVIKVRETYTEVLNKLGVQLKNAPTRV